MPLPDEDFLHWPIIVEFEDHSRISPLKEKVTLLLNSLWGESIPSIAACDFEDQLPWGGGIKRDFSSMRGFHRTVGESGRKMTVGRPLS